MEDTPLKELYQQTIKHINDIKSSKTTRERLKKEAELDKTRNLIEERLRAKISTEKADKQLYPELLDKDFNLKIYTKEFNDYRAVSDKNSDICSENLGNFSLSNQQMLVRLCIPCTL